MPMQIMQTLPRIAAFLGFGLLAVGAGAGEIRHPTMHSPWAGGSVADSDARTFARIGVAGSDGKTTDAAIASLGASHTGAESAAALRLNIGSAKPATPLGCLPSETERAVNEAFGSASFAKREPPKGVGASTFAKEASPSPKFAPNFPAGMGIRAVQKGAVPD